MEPEYIDFSIDCGIFDFSINFVITKNTEKACDFINYKLQLPTKTMLQVVEAHLDCKGKMAVVEGYCPVIWLPAAPKSPSEISTAMHEIFHAVCDCMRWAEIPLTESSEEAYCHLISHVTKQFLTKIQEETKIT